VLAKVDEDENRLRQIRGTQEGKAVHEEILRRQKSLRETANQLELEQYQHNLSSLNYQPNPNDHASLVAYLNQLDSDIQWLNQPNASDVARNLRTKLIGARNTAARQLKAVDKASSRSNKPLGPSGLFPWIGAFITGIVVGLASIFSRPNSKNAQSPSNYLPIGEVEANEEMIAVAGREVDSRPTALGCLYWFLTLIGISAIGIIAIAIIPSGGETSNISNGVPFLFVIFGFGLGARIFFQRAAENIGVKGFGGIKDIYVRSKNPGKGIRSLKAVKFWVGLTTFVCVFMVLFTVSFSLSETQTTLSYIIMLVSIPIAILMSVIVSKRTHWVSTTGME